MDNDQINAIVESVIDDNYRSEEFDNPEDDVLQDTIDAYGLIDSDAIRSLMREAVRAAIEKVQ